MSEPAGELQDPVVAMGSQMAAIAMESHNSPAGQRSQAAAGEEAKIAADIVRNVW